MATLLLCTCVSCNSSAGRPSSNEVVPKFQCLTVAAKCIPCLLKPYSNLIKTLLKTLWPRGRLPAVPSLKPWARCEDENLTFVNAGSFATFVRQLYFGFKLHQKVHRRSCKTSPADIRLWKFVVDGSVTTWSYSARCIGSDVKDEPKVKVEP